MTICRSTIFQIQQLCLKLGSSERIHNLFTCWPKSCIQATSSRHLLTISSGCSRRRVFCYDASHRTLTLLRERLASHLRRLSQPMATSMVSHLGQKHNTCVQHFRGQLGSVARMHFLISSAQGVANAVGLACILVVPQCSSHSAKDSAGWSRICSHHVLLKLAKWTGSLLHPLNAGEAHAGKYMHCLS